MEAHWVNEVFMVLILLRVHMDMKLMTYEDGVWVYFGCSKGHELCERLRKSIKKAFLKCD